MPTENSNEAASESPSVMSRLDTAIRRMLPNAGSQLDNAPLTPPPPPGVMAEPDRNPQMSSGYVQAIVEPGPGAIAWTTGTGTTTPTGVYYPSVLQQLPTSNQQIEGITERSVALERYGVHTSPTMTERIRQQATEQGKVMVEVGRDENGELSLNVDGRTILCREFSINYDMGGLMEATVRIPVTFAPHQARPQPEGEALRRIRA